MPCRRANASALPGVGEATATTSASSGIAFTDDAMQSAWKREPTIPIFTFVTRWPSGLGSGRSCPRRLPRRKRHASYPLSRHERPPPRLRHADLRREVGAHGELAHEREPVRAAGMTGLAVDVAKQCF